MVDSDGLQHPIGAPVAGLQTCLCKCSNINGRPLTATVFPLICKFLSGGGLPQEHAHEAAGIALARCRLRRAASKASTSAAILSATIQTASSSALPESRSDRWQPFTRSPKMSVTTSEAATWPLYCLRASLGAELVAAVHGDRRVLPAKRRSCSSPARNSGRHRVTVDCGRRASSTRRVASREIVPAGISSPLQAMMPTLCLSHDYLLYFVVVCRAVSAISAAISSTTAQPSSLSAVGEPNCRAAMPLQCVVHADPQPSFRPIVRRSSARRAWGSRPR